MLKQSNGQSFVHDISGEHMDSPACMDMLAEHVLSVCHENNLGTILGVVLIGSFASGKEDSLSDIDVLCVASSGRRRQLRGAFAGRRLDLEIVPMISLDKNLDQKYWRDNLYLLALQDAKVLSDHHRNIAPLLLRAQEIWKLGPPVIDARERQQLIETAEKLQSASIKIGARMSDPFLRKEKSLLMGLHLDQLYRIAMLDYVRVKMRWVFPPWIVMKLASDPFYAHLLSLYEGYFSEAQLDGKVFKIDQITNLTLRTLGEAH